MLELLKRELFPCISLRTKKINCRLFKTAFGTELYFKARTTERECDSLMISDSSLIHICCMYTPALHHTLQCLGMFISYVLIMER